MITLKTPYLLFTGTAEDHIQAKTATGINYFKAEQSIGYYSLNQNHKLFDNIPLLSLKNL